jgi:hypothetical protein
MTEYICKKEAFLSIVEIRVLRRKSYSITQGFAKELTEKLWDDVTNFESMKNLFSAVLKWDTSHTSASVKQSLKVKTASCFCCRKKGHETQRYCFIYAKLKPQNSKRKDSKI